ncbi:hypothetical protein HRbin06_00769 [archaeon HR06]|nr:hypothetical protein HRbin06_00769 [archaeon HR06]
MKKIEVLMRPDKIVDELIKELKQLNLSLTLQEITYVGKSLETVSLSSVISFKRDRINRLKLEVFVNEDQMDKVLELIRKKGKVGEEEYIAIIPMDSFSRLT